MDKGIIDCLQACLSYIESVPPQWRVMRDPASLLMRIQEELEMCYQQKACYRVTFSDGTVAFFEDSLAATASTELAAQKQVLAEIDCIMLPDSPSQFVQFLSKFDKYVLAGEMKERAIGFDWTNHTYVHDL